MNWRVLRIFVPLLAALMIILEASSFLLIANAQEVPHREIRKSLIYLVATGIGDSGSSTGVKVETRGTGFLVSDDGLILTTYHLISELGPVEPRTVEIHANIGEKAGTLRYKATVVSGREELDLLLLKIPPGIDAYRATNLASLEEVNAATQIYTSGFPAVLSYVVNSGQIMAKEGPLGNLWTVSIPIEKGQSGSPIYNQDGKVIGVAKGQAKSAPSLNFMIPIQFADSLLAHLRNAELKNQLSSLVQKLDDVEGDIYRSDDVTSVIAELQKQISWDAKMRRGNLYIEYKRLLPGGTAVNEIFVQVQPIGRDERGQKIHMGTFRGTLRLGRDDLPLKISSKSN